MRSAPAMTTFKGPADSEAIICLRILKHDQLVHATAIRGIIKVEQRADGHDPGRIDAAMAHVIMPLDMAKVHRCGDVRELVDVARIAPKLPVVDDPPLVAFEMTMIHRVETDQ